MRRIRSGRHQKGGRPASGPVSGAGTRHHRGLGSLAGTLPPSYGRARSLSMGAWPEAASVSREGDHRLGRRPTTPDHRQSPRERGQSPRECGQPPRERGQSPRASARGRRGTNNPSEPDFSPARICPGFRRSDMPPPARGQALAARPYGSRSVHRTCLRRRLRHVPTPGAGLRTPDPITLNNIQTNRNFRDNHSNNTA